MRFNVIDMDLERVFVERTLNEEIFSLVLWPSDRPDSIYTSFFTCRGNLYDRKDPIIGKDFLLAVV